MNKKEFCLLLLRYIKDGFEKVDIETRTITVEFNFSKNIIITRKYYFLIEEPGAMETKIYYKDVKAINP